MNKSGAKESTDKKKTGYKKNFRYLLSGVWEEWHLGCMRNFVYSEDYLIRIT
ncbi:MAG: hypothetical protein GWN59_01165 [Calditrichae bacterium]|nr:hypothetical protein [Calditrichia bacterium]NIV71434.1 hypothetical protein [Calditrichia bacterium]